MFSTHLPVHLIFCDFEIVVKANHMISLVKTQTCSVRSSHNLSGECSIDINVTISGYDSISSDGESK